MFLLNGGFFDGTFVNNRAHGPGTLTRIDGTVTGEFKNDWLAISKTKCVRADGSDFVGDVHDGQPHGVGELKLFHGGVQRGSFHEGMLVGRCTIVYDDGVTVWEGELPKVNDPRFPIGIEWSKDGTRRMGRWREQDLLKEIPVPAKAIRSTERLTEAGQFGSETV